MKPRLVIGIVGAVLLVAFAIYLNWVFRQVESAFLEVEEFIPTRVFSDVVRVAAPETRKSVDERLKTLNYKPQWKAAKNELSFEIHPIHFPVDLLPEDHPMAAYVDQSPAVKIHFTGSDPQSQISEILLDGEPVADLFLEPELVATLSRAGIEPGQQIREVLKFSEIPASVWQAIIAVEDQHFLSHNGLDPRGLARAIFVNLKSLSFRQGGSTITQQLVKNLMSRRTKNLFKKANEAFLALLLEIRFSKEEILERYLNEVYLGQVGNYEVHGVSEGAKHFFGKRLEELNLAEVALMAGLIRGPGFYSPYRYPARAFERQKLVLEKMVETGQIVKEEAADALQQKMVFAPPQNFSNKAPYFVDYVKAKLIDQTKDKLTEEEVLNRGFRIYTTLDSRLNRIAQEQVEKNLKELEGIEGALASVEHSTGRIRALVGGKSYSVSQFNRILNMKRQAGSTFKPLVFLSAFLMQHDPQGVPYGPAYPLEDAPWTLIYDRGKQKWSPKNYEKEFKGWVSFREVLSESINTATARLAIQVGLTNIIETAHKLGIESELMAVPSLSLGASDVSPLELLRAYSGIASRGVDREHHVIRLITEENGVPFARFVPREEERVDPNAVDLLIEMMRTTFTSGTARSSRGLGWTRPAAGKTGTTTQHRDAWFAGFTPQLTTIAWVGEDAVQKPQDKDSKKKEMKLTGASNALPIWVGFMNAALQDLPVLDFPPNPQWVAVKVDRHSGRIAEPQCPESQTLSENYPEFALESGRACEEHFPASSSESNVDDL